MPKNASYVGLQLTFDKPVDFDFHIMDAIHNVIISKDKQEYILVFGWSKDNTELNYIMTSLSPFVSSFGCTILPIKAVNISDYEKEIEKAVARYAKSLTPTKAESSNLSIFVSKLLAFRHFENELENALQNIDYRDFVESLEK